MIQSLHRLLSPYTGSWSGEELTGFEKCLEDGLCLAGVLMDSFEIAQWGKLIPVGQLETIRKGFASVCHTIYFTSQASTYSKGRTTTELHTGCLSPLVYIKLGLWKYCNFNFL